MLTKNDQIPTNLTVHNEIGQQVSLRSYLGEPLVIYFYPKNSAPCCVEQARFFHNLYFELRKIRVKLIGVSKDSIESHWKMKNKLQLNYELLSDSERLLQKAFGVQRKRRMFGKTYWGTTKATFFVDESGRVLDVLSSTDPKEHVRTVHKNYIDTRAKN